LGFTASLAWFEWEWTCHLKDLMGYLSF